MNFNKLKRVLNFKVWRLRMYLKGYRRGSRVTIKQYPFLIEKSGIIMGFWDRGFEKRHLHMFEILEERYTSDYGLCYIYKYYNLEDVHLNKK